MSKLNTLSKGYKEGSLRSRSTNPPITTPNDLPIKVDANLLSNQMKQWYSGGNLSKDDIQVIIKELNKLVL
tara:strand:+ start:13530 stop:13742 length:213 start_codon:yes stop_codon:yes gene_type:complete